MLAVEIHLKLEFEKMTIFTDVIKWLLKLIPGSETCKNGQKTSEMDIPQFKL